ncbi:MAG TPA: energy-coupling factor transporter ATPase, partial [Candidatus Binatus sp.]|nr:energy-coupling factor transporter ATPase [Candidatus Binatus sp.]
MKTDAQIPVRTAAAHAASVEGVTFTYHGADRPALRAVTFAQAAGETIGVMGASGAGKSTLAKCLNRIVPEFEDGDFHGAITIAGEPLEHLRVCDVAPKVGMVFQDFESQLFSTNVAHEVAFAMEQVGMNRAEMDRRIMPALEAVGLRGFEHRDPMSLSGGEKQRLAIASVLALRPSVIVLDEPTTDLDPEGRAEVFALIAKLRAEGLSLIVIEHESEELRAADRIIVLREGEVAADGPPAEVFARTELLTACGVRPPGLGRALELLGIDAQPKDVDAALEAILRTYPRLAKTLIEGPADSSVEHPPTAAAKNPAFIGIENVSFGYADGPRVLDSIDLQVEAGEFLAIVGQNGSGKTTLAKHIVGLLQPATGRVTIDGKDRTQMRPAETARAVAYVFQNPDHQIFAATVEDEVAFGPRNFGLAEDEIRRRCDEALEAVGLQNERQSDPFLLSKGERQRLAVASVLVLRPRMLILDEPTTGLDYREQRRMMALVSELNRSGIAIIMITHTPWLVAEFARRVVLMGHGEILYDGDVQGFFDDTAMLAGSSFIA